MDRKILRPRLLTLMLTVSVLSIPALAQRVAPSADRPAPVRVGIGVSQGGSWTPNGIAAQASVTLAHRRDVSVDALASVRWRLFDPYGREHYSFGGDSSLLQRLASVAARVRLGVSPHIEIAAFGGLAAGSWIGLPSSDARRKPIKVPYLGAGGVFRTARDLSIELSVENFRNVHYGDDATNVTLLVGIPLRL